MKDAEHDGMPIVQTSKFFLSRCTFADESTKLVGAVLRGDHEVNPVKVKNFVGAMEMAIGAARSCSFAGFATGPCLAIRLGLGVAKVIYTRQDPGKDSFG